MLTNEEFATGEATGKVLDCVIGLSSEKADQSMILIEALIQIGMRGKWSQEECAAFVKRAIEMYPEWDNHDTFPQAD